MPSRYELRQGDCLEVLRTLPDSSVDAVVTDPPYGMSFMGKHWDYDVPSVEIWAECLRVLKPGGYLLAFAGTRTQHRMAVRIEDAGFEIRDLIAWVSAYRMPKHVSCLKPAIEPITMARKPAKRATPLNIDACRVPAVSDADAKGYADKCASVVGLASNINGSTYGEWAGMRTDSASPIGRWPANLIHDGSDEVVALFPDSKGSGGSVPNVKITGYGDGIGAGKSEYFGGERAKVNNGAGSAARFFYSARASKTDRGAGNTHATVKPTDLMAYLCRLVTPPDGVVLDPFMGSGSTGKAALREGFRFIGVEREPEYLAIAYKRLFAETVRLFDVEALA
jgi:DNA modification methylase